MAFSFIPRKLQQAEKDIAELHRRKSSIPRISDNKELKELVMSLVQLKYGQTGIRVFALTDRELYLIAKYIPHNYYKVDMTNLFSVFELRPSEQLWAALYEQWQESYQNSECNEFICNSLESNAELESFIRKMHMTPHTFGIVLKGEDIPSAFLKEVMECALGESRCIADRLEYFGVRKRTLLYKKCRSGFFLCCGKKEYLSIQEFDLLEAVRRYKEEHFVWLKDFLINFLSKLSLRELQKFQSLAEYLQMAIGEGPADKDRYKRFVDGLPQEIEQKYADWINQSKVWAYFGEDERSIFWKQYRFVSVRKIKKSNVVVMEFRNHYALEFLGKGMGPMYIFTRDYFEKDIQKKLTWIDNMQMRKELLHSADSADQYRKEHRGNWQTDVHKYLREHHMTDYLEL